MTDFVSRMSTPRTARIAEQCAWAALIFCFVVAAVLMGVMIRDKISNPLLAPALFKFVPPKGADVLGE